MATHKRKTYQNKPKTLCTIVFDLDSECKFIKNETVYD